MGWSMRAAGSAAAAGLLLVIAAVALVGPRAASPGSLLAAPSWLVAPPAFNLKQEDKKVQTVLASLGSPGLRAVQALHSRDANFPAVSREGSAQGAAAKTGGHARGSYPPRFSAQTSHAAPGARPRAPAHHGKAGAVETPEEEWQADHKKMSVAVRDFHKYGDSALEKLIPARTSAREYKKALTKGEQQINRLQDARKQGQLDEANANGALSALEKGIAQQDALKREALKARAEGKEYAQKMQIQDLKKKIKLQEERDRRREDIVKAQVAALAKENRALRHKDDKVTLQLEEVPAVGAREGNLEALRKQIKSLQASEGSKVEALKDEVVSMQKEMVCEEKYCCYWEDVAMQARVRA